MTEVLDHKQALAAIAPEAHAKLLEKSNARGLLHLAGHAGAILALALAIAWKVPLWPLLMLPLGILIVFLFTTLHKSIHETAFETPALNRAVAAVSGFLVFVPPLWFRYFHFAHHRHTHDMDHDPELEGGKPATVSAYLLYLSGFTVWRGNLTVMVRNTRGRADYSYVPQARRSGLVREARIILALYALLTVLSLALGWSLLLWVWIVPVLIGQPFLRAYLLAEHTRCPHVANMLENTRTTFTWPVIRFIAWNMPYHAEHHALPTVPFWKLPALHARLKSHLQQTENGYLRFHRKLAETLSTDERAGAGGKASS